MTNEDQALENLLQDNSHLHDCEILDVRHQVNRFQFSVAIRIPDEPFYADAGCGFVLRADGVQDVFIDFGNLSDCEPIIISDVEIRSKTGLARERLQEAVFSLAAGGGMLWRVSPSIVVVCRSITVERQVSQLT